MKIIELIEQKLKSLKNWNKKNKKDLQKTNNSIEKEYIKNRNEKIAKFLKENPEFSNLSRSDLLKEYYSYSKANIEKKGNFIMIFLTVIIALSAYGSYISTSNQTDAIQRSYFPQIFYSDGKCPSVIYKESWQSNKFTINFGNYGRIPVLDFTIIDSGENINITCEYGCINYHNHTENVAMTPIELKNNQEDIHRYNILLENSSKQNASFAIYWGYSEKLGVFIPKNITCNYNNLNGSFILK